MGGHRRPAPRRAADLECHHRLFPGDPQGVLDEASALADPLQVESDDPGVGIGSDLRQQFGLAEVHLVAQAEQLRETEALPAGPVDHRLADGAGMGEKGDVPRGRAGQRQEAGVDRQVGVQKADGIGAQHPHAVAAGDLQTARFQRLPHRPDLAEAARSNDGHPHPALAAVLQRLRNGRGRDDDHGQVDRIRNAGQVKVHRPIEEHAAARIDEVQRTPIPGDDQVAGDPVAEFGRIARGADHHHAARLEEGFQHSLSCGWLFYASTRAFAGLVATPKTARAGSSLPPRYVRMRPQVQD